ncbi:phage portal protein [Marinobacterium jannaschii]|uniref:phage portal protein n=1 Tax=Marinobacterium jannaschii TaxID=64970 RepID=UPI000687AB34|nr:phage portal protein [Marinobacterium jannaschii]
MSEQQEARKTRRGVPGRVRFAVAQQGRHGPQLGGVPLSVNEELRRDLGAIKQQSRRAGNDDGYVTKFLSMCQTHIVGPEGFGFQSAAMLSDGRKDKRANGLIEQAFKRWGRRGVCDVTGQYSWRGIQEMVVKSVAEDGEVLIRLVRGADNGFGFAVQLLDSAHLDINYNRELKNGNRVRMGVEFDDWGRPVAYHILTNHPGDRAYFYGNTRYERIPASDMLLVYLPYRVGQARGVPWAHAALLEMHHLYGYREAELTGARVAASKMFAYEPDSDVEPEEDDESEEDFVEEVEPGMGIVVPYGYSIKEMNFQHPGGNFGAFMKEGKRGAASGLDVNYNTLANDLEGVNFSSLRQAVLEDRDGWKRRQSWLREWVLEPVFVAWLEMALLSGAIGDLRFSHYERLNAPVFQGRRWEWVDPLKDEKANTEAINNLTKSPLKIIRERGEDPETVINEILEFEEMVASIRKLRGSVKSEGRGSNGKEEDEPEAAEAG